MPEAGNSSGGEICLNPVGIARTPYNNRNQAPFQGRFSSDESVIEVYDCYSEALKDVNMSSHLYILYWAHLAGRDTLQTVTPWGPETRGVFACRSPARPNPISLCVVKLVKREGNRLTVIGLDALDGSSVLDIKPYSGEIDSVPEARIGWFEERRKNGGTGAG
jgi:tRNA-Thr(GGU) m(6)t(6)A37 methyltransferase TsaA